MKIILTGKKRGSCGVEGYEPCCYTMEEELEQDTQSRFLRTAMGGLSVVTRGSYRDLWAKFCPFCGEKVKISDRRK